MILVAGGSIWSPSILLPGIWLSQEALKPWNDVATSNFMMLRLIPHDRFFLNIFLTVFSSGFWVECGSLTMLRKKSVVSYGLLGGSKKYRTCCSLTMILTTFRTGDSRVAKMTNNLVMLWCLLVEPIDWLTHKNKKKALIPEIAGFLSQDVARLGVTCVETPEGVTEDVWEEGVTICIQTKRCNQHMYPIIIEHCVGEKELKTNKTRKQSKPGNFFEFRGLGFLLPTLPAPAKRVFHF